MAITDQQIIQGLEMLQEWEAAYPLVYKQAVEIDDYPSWRNLAAIYADYDTNDEAYVLTWNKARELDNEGAYQDFIKIRDVSPYNPIAIHRIFELRQALDTIQGYLDFIELFPNSVEAVQAMLRIHEIAFSRAQEENVPEVYDAFIITFPEAKQVPEAIKLAFSAELDSLESETQPGLLDFKSRYYSDENKERIARRIFNEGRVAENAKDELVMDRKYRLLSQELFHDSEVFTEMLDRNERQAHEQRMILHQERIQGNIKTLKSAVVNELKTTASQLEDAIRDHNRRVKQQFQKVYDDVNQSFGRVDSQFSRLYGHINSQFGAISQAVEQQANFARQAAYEAQAQQDRLFQRASEDARFQSQKSRRCNEELAKRGKYGWLSSCP